MTEVYILEQRVVAGEYVWVVFADVETVKQAATDHAGTLLQWSEFAFDSSVGAEVCMDTGFRYEIIRVPIGVFLTDYSG